MPRQVEQPALELIKQGACQQAGAKPEQEQKEAKHKAAQQDLGKRVKQFVYFG